MPPTLRAPGNPEALRGCARQPDGLLDYLLLDYLMGAPIWPPMPLTLRAPGNPEALRGCARQPDGLLDYLMGAPIWPPMPPTLRAPGNPEALRGCRRRPNADGQGAHGSLRRRAALPAAATFGHARRVGAVAAGQDARVGSADRHPLGGAAPRALQRRAAAGRADVLEPAHVGRVRRHLREPGAAAALRAGAPPARSAVLFHHADHGGGPARRGLVADGRAAGPVLSAAAESAHGRRRRHPRGAAD